MHIIQNSVIPNMQASSLFGNICNMHFIWYKDWWHYSIPEWKVITFSSVTNWALQMVSSPKAVEGTANPSVTLSHLFVRPVISLSLRAKDHHVTQECSKCQSASLICSVHIWFQSWCGFTLLNLVSLLMSQEWLPNHIRLCQ